MTAASPHHRKRTTTAAIPALPPMPPLCGNCGTDEALIFEAYEPAVYDPHGRGLRPASVSYTCGNCGNFNAHHVPPSWVPPGWHWFA